MTTEQTFEDYILVSYIPVEEAYRAARDKYKQVQAIVYDHMEALLKATIDPFADNIYLYSVGYEDGYFHYEILEQDEECGDVDLHSRGKIALEDFVKSIDAYKKEWQARKKAEEVQIDNLRKELIALKDRDNAAYLGLLEKVQTHD